MTIDPAKPWLKDGPSILKGEVCSLCLTKDFFRLFLTLRTIFFSNESCAFRYCYGSLEANVSEIAVIDVSSSTSAKVNLALFAIVILSGAVEITVVLGLG